MSKSGITDTDKGWKDLVRRAQALSGGMEIKVGVLADDAAGGLHEKDANGKSKPLTVAEIAAVLEYGTEDGTIPARPAIRSTFDKMRAELQGDAEKLAVKIIFGEVTALQAFNILGLKLSSAIKATITQGDEVAPTNADSVKKRKEAKGSGGRWGIRTWVDTGRVVGAITWAVLVKGKRVSK